MFWPLIYLPDQKSHVKKFQTRFRVLYQKKRGFSVCVLVTPRREREIEREIFFLLSRVFKAYSSKSLSETYYEKITHFFYNFFKSL